MESIFDKQTAQGFIERINKLTPQTPAQWGKMNVSQMLAHMQAPLQIASGQMVLKVNPLIRILFGRMGRKQLLNDPAFAKNSPTMKEAKITDQRDFETEKKKLIRLIEEFQQKGPAGLTKDRHPFFGELSSGDWDKMQLKHINHHLDQFGV